MELPDWYGLVLLALAAYRTWKLLAEDTILEPLRRKLGPSRKSVFLACPWCAGWWIALAWWGAWELWPDGTLIATVPFALSALVGILGWAINTD